MYKRQGVTTVALDAEETALVADVALACLSYRRLLLEQVDRVTVDVDCVDAELTDELLRAAVIETFTPNAPATAEEAIADVYRGCLRRVLALVPPGGALAFADVELDEDEQFLADLLAYQHAVAGLEQPYHLVDLSAANCVGAQIVSGVGVERLTELGLTVDAVAEGVLPASVTLTSDDAAAFTEAVYQCVDARGALARRLIDDADVGPVVLGCLSDALPATLVRSAARASATGAAFDPAGEAAFQAVVVDVFTECLDEGSLLLLGADPDADEAP